MLLCPTAFFFQFFNLGYTLCCSTSLRESTDPSHNNIPYICLGAKLTTSSIYPQISNGPLKRDQVQRTKDVHWLFTPTFSFGVPGFFNQDSKDNNGKPALDSSPLSPSDCSVAGFSGQQHDAASMVDSRSGQSVWLPELFFIRCILCAKSGSMEILISVVLFAHATVSRQA